MEDHKTPPKMADAMEECFESLAKNLVGRLLEKYHSEISYYQNKLEELRKIHECEIEEREKQYTSSMNKAKYKILIKSEENKKLRALLNQNNITVPSLNKLIEIKTLTMETTKDLSILTTPLPSPNRRSLRLGKPKKRPIYHDKPYPLDNSIINGEKLGGVSKKGVTQSEKDSAIQQIEKDVTQFDNKKGVAQDYKEGVAKWPLIETTSIERDVPHNNNNDVGVAEEYDSDVSDTTVCHEEASDESILLFTSCYHGNNNKEKLMMDEEIEGEEWNNEKRSSSPSLIKERVEMMEKNLLYDPPITSHNRSHGRSHHPPIVSHDRSHDPLILSHDRSHDLPITSHDRSHDSIHSRSLNKKRRKSYPSTSKKIKQATMTQLMTNKPHPPAHPTDNDITIIQEIRPQIVPPTPFIGPALSVYNWNKDTVHNNYHDDGISNHMTTSIDNQPQSTADKDKTITTLSKEQQIAHKAGLPTYKCVVNLRKKEDRQKLTAMACPECTRWFKAGNGLYDNVKDHLQKTCRHRHLYLPPESDPSIWNIGFPDESMQ